MDLIKATYFVSTACSVVVAGVSLFALEQNAQLNRTIAAGTADLKVWADYQATTPLARS